MNICMKKFVWPFFFAAIALTSGCASNGASVDSAAKPDTDSPEHDRMERMNKGVYGFNSRFDKSFLKPVAKGYVAITPKPVGRGITNFFQNISEPRVMLNSVLQGKLDRGMISAARFVINSTVGLGGLIDWAGMSGAPFKDEDFGQTLAVWGWKKTNYVVLPILGPSTDRDAVGEIVDFFTDPLIYYRDVNVRNGLYVLRMVNKRANALTTTDIISEAGGEQEYEFVREAYKQRRKSQVTDGAPPPLEGLEFIEDD